jgi:DNA-binding FadR family transcriptional regulator
MASQSGAVERVLDWVGEQVQAGRLPIGDPLPSERVLSQRLRVSRGAVREARARLCGQGVLGQDRLRFTFASHDGASLFRDWIRRTVEAPREDCARRWLQALELRRFLLPEVLALATQRAPPEKLAKLAERMTDLRISIQIRVYPGDLAASHDRMMGLAADLTRRPVLVAWCAGLAEAMRGIPIWGATCENRDGWRSALEQVADLIKAGQAGHVRRVLRGHLRKLDTDLANRLGLKQKSRVRIARTQDASE